MGGKYEPVPLKAHDNLAQTIFADPDPHVVQALRGGHRPRRRRAQHPEERELALTDQETTQTQGELRGERQHVQVHQRDHDEHAPVAEGVDDLYSPLPDTGEQFTHRNPLTDISVTEYPQGHILHDACPKLPHRNDERSKKSVERHKPDDRNAPSPCIRMASLPCIAAGAGGARYCTQAMVREAVKPTTGCARIS